MSIACRVANSAEHNSSAVSYTHLDVYKRQTVREALLVAATACSPPVERESESSLRRRRSALALLIEIGIRPETWPLLRRLMQDKDSKIAVLACKICLMSAIESEKGTAIQRLIRLLPNMDFVLTDEIEQCLALVM